MTIIIGIDTEKVNIDIEIGIKSKLAMLVFTLFRIFQNSEKKSKVVFSVY